MACTFCPDTLVGNVRAFVLKHTNLANYYPIFLCDCKLNILAINAVPDSLCARYTRIATHPYPDPESFTSTLLSTCPTIIPTRGEHDWSDIVVHLRTSDVVRAEIPGSQFIHTDYYTNSTEYDAIAKKLRSILDQRRASGTEVPGGEGMVSLVSGMLYTNAEDARMSAAYIGRVASTFRSHGFKVRLVASTPDQDFCTLAFSDILVIAKGTYSMYAAENHHGSMIIRDIAKDSMLKALRYDRSIPWWLPSNNPDMKEYRKHKEAIAQANVRRW